MPLPRSIRQRLRASAMQLGAAARVLPTRLTDAGSMRELLRALSPRATEHGLIRLGPEGDGGYLVPDDLEGIAAAFSPGVNTVSGFERDCAERGMDVYLADRSVEGPAEEHARFHFRKTFVGATSEEGFITLDEWVASTSVAPTAELLLQMDIEGYEYEVLLSTSPALLARFRVVVVEFHQLDQLWSAPFFGLARRALDKLLQTHVCVHAHPNNTLGSVRLGGLEVPRLAELTFLRRDRAAKLSPRTDFPHPLDRDNDPSRPPLVLPPAWYGAGSSPR